VNEAARAFEHAVQDALGGRHLPQHVHVQAALAVRALMRDLRLIDPAGDGVADQLLVALAPGAPQVALRDLFTGLVDAVGVDAREGADPATGGPGTRTFAVRHGDALAAFDERQHLATGNQQ
jgi:hypothetical protein